MAGYDSNKYMTGPKKLGVPAYMNMRQHGPNTSNVTDPRTGMRLSLQEAQALGPLYHSGWNTSGVGPGSAGYRGRGHIDAHIYAPREPRTGPLSPDYGAHFGGLNEFYQNQQQAGAWDRLQGNAAMDRQDAMGSRWAQQLRNAMQVGDYATAAQYADALNNRAAQTMNAVGTGGGFYNSTGGMDLSQPHSSMIGGGIGQSSMAPNDGDIRWDSSGNQWRYNQALGKGEMIAPTQGAGSTRSMLMYKDEMPESFSLGQSSPLATMTAGNEVGSATRFDPRYGTGSISHSAGPRNATFTMGQGSAGPGGTFSTGIRSSNPSGVESASDFFQNAANRQRIPNKFASPQIGFNGQQDTSLTGYANRLMAVKNKLKG